MTTKRTRKVVGSVPKTEPTEQEIAMVDISNRIRIASDALDDAQKIAAKHHVDFSFDYEGHSWYYKAPPKPTVVTRAEAIARLSADEYVSDEELKQLRQALISTTNDTDTYSWTSSYDDSGWNSSNC